MDLGIAFGVRQMIQLGLVAGDDSSEKWQDLWLWAAESCGAGQG